MAQIAGVGLAWYTWLEQGRDVNVSTAVLEQLNVALALTPAEREYVFTLAHNRPPPRFEFEDRVVSPASAALLGQIANAAYVANRRWDVLAWNAPAVDLFTDLAAPPNGRPNMLHLLFTSAVLRSLHVDWEIDARTSLEKFRLDFWRHSAEPSFLDLVAHLQEASDEFRRWWATPFVHPTVDGTKRFRASDGKPVDHVYSVLTLSENPSQRLVVFMPLTAGSPIYRVSHANTRGSDDLV